MPRHSEPRPNPATQSATTGLEDAFAAVQELAAVFQGNEAYYLASTYPELQVRMDFIDKFLIALGWDVNHNHQKNPFQQEVKVERPKAGSQRRADYAFYLAPNYRDVRFFVEAKKPFGDIATPDNCFQTIRYGWNAQTPVAVLTNFEQFQILDCRYKPDIDTATGQILMKCHYRDYTNPERFAEIYYRFSHESVAAGSLEQYAETLPKRRGKAVQLSFLKGGFQSIDEAFLLELDEYRDHLARAFKNKNPELDGEILTEITQRVIDRLVFIRFLEDKMIEPEHLMSEFGDKGTVWQDFIAASRKLDSFCNGVVFRKHAIIDSPDFKVDDNVFGDICESLAHVNSPYDFNAIPIHILGSIYERFLGKVITTTGKRAKVEEKPEVRKAGGVYYTPEYIVRYIVENTVGKLIEGKTPAKIAGMRFADIACGSGSFLLGVFDLLLRYHRDWYNAHPTQAKKDGCEQRDDGAWHLSLSQRRVILLNNIYGVDIDRQAVEVAQLSLYLKLLEEETTATARAYQLQFHETLLPPLNKNIVCGNSLIGTDILDGQLFEPVEEKKLNPMDFEDRFPEVMKRGGFDAIVGNPPYIQLSMEPFRNYTANVYLKEFYGLSGGRLNTFAFFLERARQETKEGGRISYIVPNTILSQEYYEEVRLRLINNADIEAVSQPIGTIFKNAVVETVVLVFKKNSRKVGEVPKGQVEFSRLRADGICESTVRMKQSELPGNYKASFIRPLKPEFESVRAKIERAKARLGSFVNVNQAIALKHDRAACLTDKKLSPDYREVLDGRHIGRYFTGCSPNFFKFDVSRIHSCKREDIFLLPEKIFFRRVGDRLIGTIDRSQKFALNTIVVISQNLECPYGLSFILALFNCALCNFYYVNFLKSSKKVFSEIQARQIEQLPIPLLDLTNPADKTRHDRIVSLVEQMVSSKQLLSAAKSDADKDFYLNRCTGLDRQIDALVYELYGLTPEEIQIVEGSDSPALQLAE
ncbi:MAG: N-6 DNA methylase [Candidatus Sumerlaeota bacterium]|nr:N-6 DNA methylase [Candidatus Sumerlaeota bacterium]